MLVLLPPSEGKAAATRGKPLDLQALSWPELAPARTRVIDALVELTSGDVDHARKVLGISPRLDEELRRDAVLHTAPTLPAERLYTGVLYQALDIASLDAAALRWARKHVVVVSALMGLLHLKDRVPSYRLNICTRLPPVGHLVDYWRRELPDALTSAAGRGLVVDMRSSDYASIWRPKPPIAERTVQVHVKRGAKVVSHDAKWTRGLVTRQLALASTTWARPPRTPEELVDALAPAFTVSLEPAGASWRLNVLL